VTVPADLSEETIVQWRTRLGDISWFMRMLNEPLARIANAEDGCKGHFWESRFKSVPLLDDAALIACMAYVDLNPVKAGVAIRIEESEFTSIRERMEKAGLLDDFSGMSKKECTNRSNRGMGPVAGETTSRVSPAVSLEQYVALLKSTAEALSASRPSVNALILDRLDLRPSGWMRAVSDFLSLFRSAAGGDAAYAAFMERTGRIRKQDAFGRRRVFQS